MRKNTLIHLFGLCPGNPIVTIQQQRCNACGARPALPSTDMDSLEYRAAIDELRLCYDPTADEPTLVIFVPNEDN